MHNYIYTCRRECVGVCECVKVGEEEEEEEDEEG